MMGGRRLLSREAVKYIVTAAMLADHIAVLFLPEASVFYVLLRCAGSMTAVTMCALLTEGFHRSSDLRAYRRRLFIFAVISQIPYSLAFRGVEGHSPLNMLLNLYLCLRILEEMYSPSDDFRKSVRMLLYVLLCFFCDWSLLAPCFVLLFERGWRNPEFRVRAWTAAVALNAAADLGALLTGRPLPVVLRMTACGIVGQSAAAVLVLFCYSHRKAGVGAGFHKWVFYVFYPLHLAVLGVVKAGMA